MRGSVPKVNADSNASFALQNVERGIERVCECVCVYACACA